jgi:hypothetical protein
MMYRRTFLKMIALGAASTALPLNWFGGSPGFNYGGFQWKHEYGNALALAENPLRLPKNWQGEYLKILERDMRKFIPPLYRSKVQVKISEPYDFERVWHLAWHYPGIR